MSAELVLCGPFQVNPKSLVSGAVASIYAVESAVTSSEIGDIIPGQFVLRVASKIFDGWNELAKVPAHPTIMHPAWTSANRQMMLFPRARADLFEYMWREQADGMDKIRDVPVMTRSTQIRIAQSLVHAVLHLHRYGVAHRDIKPENVLVFGDTSVMLADFDMATSSALSAKLVGTRRYTPIDLVAPYAPKENDAYALGVTLCELLLLNAVQWEAKHEPLTRAELHRALCILGRRWGGGLEAAMGYLLFARSSRGLRLVARNLRQLRSHGMTTSVRSTGTRVQAAAAEEFDSLDSASVCSLGSRLSKTPELEEQTRSGTFVGSSITSVLS